MVSEEGPKMSLYKRMEMAGSSYGAMAYQDNVTEFLNSFFHSNDDQRDVMAMMAMEGHGVRLLFKSIRFFIRIKRESPIDTKKKKETNWEYLD